MFVSDGVLRTKTPTVVADYFPHTAPMSTAGWPSAYAAIYRAQLWVYVLVAKRARATARLPLPVYKRDDLNRPRADEHPMATLLSSPNPAMSGFDLWLWTSSTFDIFGEAYWYKRRRGGEVVGLYPLHPGALGHDERTGRWSFDNGKLRLPEIDDRDLVAFRSYNPDSLIRGLSAIEPLRSTLENEWNARNATSSFWKNGARPGTFLMHKGQISRGAATRLKEQYADLAAGSGATGSTMVLEEGMEPKTMTLTAEEAQYIETRKLNREEVCAAFDTPPPVVHILDRATFSNITEQMRSMYRDTMAPHLRGFEAAIERDLRRVEWPADDVYAEFLMDEVLRGSFETRQQALKSADHMTIAEKRRMENLPFIDGTDRIFLNTATQPLDAIDAAAAQSAGDELTIAGRAFTDSVVRTLMGRLSRPGSLDEVDPKALVAGIDQAAAGAVLHTLALERAAGGTVETLRRRVRTLVEE